LPLLLARAGERALIFLDISRPSLGLQHAVRPSAGRRDDDDACAAPASALSALRRKRGSRGQLQVDRAARFWKHKPRRSREWRAETPYPA
jgi:hypothetical protein